MFWTLHSPVFVPLLVHSWLPRLGLGLTLLAVFTAAALVAWPPSVPESRSLSVLRVSSFALLPCLALPCESHSSVVRSLTTPGLASSPSLGCLNWLTPLAGLRPPRLSWLSAFTGRGSQPLLGYILRLVRICISPPYVMPCLARGTLSLLPGLCAQAFNVSDR